MPNDSAQVRQDIRAALSPIKLAIRWDCSRQHIYNLINEEKLKSFYVGRHVRIPFSVIEVFERGDS